MEINPDFINLLLIYLIYSIGAASPGPANFAIISYSASQGRRVGIFFALGVLSGSFFWAIVAASGLLSAMQIFGSLFYWIKIIGGIYLFWLGYKSILSYKNSTELSPNSIEAKQVPIRFAYLKGLLLHLTNPKPVFGWLAIIAMSISPELGSMGIYLAVVGCLILGFVIFIGYALIFSTDFMATRFSKIKKQVDLFMAGVFGLAGYKVITSELN